VECGERQAGAPVRAALRLPLGRYAPLLVVLTVVAAAAGVVVHGSLNPKTPPAVPRREAPAAPAENLPQGHPPLAIPEQVKQAMQDLAQKAAAAPDDLETWKHVAEVQYRAGQIERAYLNDAAASFRHILERDPSNIEAIRHLGNIAFDQEQADTAIDYYQRYLKMKPDDLNVQTDLATMYLAAGKTDEAIQRYETIVMTNPSFFQAQFNLGVAYRSLGQADKMTAALEKARSIAPDDASRNQVDQFLARAKGLPPPAAVAAAPPAAAAAPAPGSGGTFKADAEALFRTNAVLGPKVQRVEWTGPESARVYVREFPMDQMGDGMRAMFVERMRGRIKEKKQAYNVAQTTRFEMVDESSGRVMETITE
jgi:tetratricopeptide (TPR) repeat protein